MGERALWRARRAAARRRRAWRHWFDRGTWVPALERLVDFAGALSEADLAALGDSTEPADLAVAAAAVSLGRAPDPPLILIRALASRDPDAVVEVVWALRRRPELLGLLFDRLVVADPEAAAELPHLVPVGLWSAAGGVERVRAFLQARRPDYCEVAPDLCTVAWPGRPHEVRFAPELTEGLVEACLWVKARVGWDRGFAGRPLLVSLALLTTCCAWNHSRGAHTILDPTGFFDADGRACLLWPCLRGHRPAPVSAFCHYVLHENLGHWVDFTDRRAPDPPPTWRTFRGRHSSRPEFLAAAGFRPTAPPEGFLPPASLWDGYRRPSGRGLGIPNPGSPDFAEMLDDPAEMFAQAQALYALDGPTLRARPAWRQIYADLRDRVWEGVELPRVSPGEDPLGVRGADFAIAALTRIMAEAAWDYPWESDEDTGLPPERHWVPYPLRRGRALEESAG